MQSHYRLVNTNEPCYKSVNYGNNIRFVTKKRDQLINTVSDVIDLTKVKHNYCIVVARTEECIKFFPNLCIINVGALYQHCPIDSVSSGYSILLLASAKSSSENEPRNKWDQDDFLLLKRCKQNVIKKKNNHYNSVGHYFSFGNKAAFRVENNSSVSLYSTRSAHGKYDSKYLCKLAKHYEEQCSHELIYAQERLCKVLPLNKSFAMPIISALHGGVEEMNYQSPLHNTLTNVVGCWSSCICVNAETHVLHMEKDSTYTIISCPRQLHVKTRYEFNFSLNSKHNISLFMNPGISFMFSGYFLKHKQYKCDPHMNEIFYNFSSYGNQRLLNHLYQTIN